jgi:nucleoside-diphosphate-sugar epimerase
VALERVLITGAAGYVGSVMSGHFLGEGLGVRGFDSLLYGGRALLGLVPHRRFEFFHGDVRSEADCRRALEGVDAVVHLAAIVGDPACKKRPDLARSVNLEGTRTLLAAARASGAARFLFMSTCSNYGVLAANAVATEASALAPVSLYAETKVQCEREVLAAADDRFAASAFRLSTVHGVSPRMRFDLLVNDFTKEAYARRKLTVHGLQFWRPYIHVADVARAALAALRAEPSKTSGEVFNVGRNDQNYMKRTIVERVCARVPGTEVVGVQSEFDPRSYKVSFDKFETVLAYRPERTVEDGIGEVLSMLESKAIADFDDPAYSN